MNSNSSKDLRILKGMDVLNMDVSVQDAAHIMSTSTHDHLPVIDIDNNIFGMLTPIDILRFLESGGNSASTKAWEICSHTLITASANLSLKEIARIMLDNQVHHVFLMKGTEFVRICSYLDIVTGLLKPNEQSGSV